MSDDKGGRELTPREPDQIEETDSAVTATADGDSRGVERFSSGPRAHSAGLTEERSAQIVRQSASARNFVFLSMQVKIVATPCQDMDTPFTVVVWRRTLPLKGFDAEQTLAFYGRYVDRGPEAAP